MKTAKCETCGTEFNYEPFIFMGKEKMTPRWCDPCILKQREEEDNVENNRRSAFEWEHLCPPLYRDTEMKRLLPRFREIIDEWEFGPKGIGFIDNPGVGKTRTAFMLLKKHIWLNRKCAAVSSTRYAMLCSDQFAQDDQARDSVRLLIGEIRDADILLFDDIGKGKMTERAELELYDLLEHRTSHLLPTIWTANSTSKKLREAMSNERGESIMRRLMEFSDIV